MLLKRRRQGDEREPEAVVDHGEPTGGEREALAICAGDMLADRGAAVVFSPCTSPR